MAKYTYELMGSNYDRYQKNPYTNQTVIRVEGIPLTSLEEIDAFTCDKSEIDFSKYLPEKDRDKTHFSIRVTNNKTEESYFVRTIFAKPELLEVINGIKKEPIKIDGKYKTIHKVPFTPLVASVWQKIERALEEGDQDTLDRFYHPNSTYAFKLKRYLGSSFASDESLRALRDLQQEFFDYPLFRKAFLSREKKFERKTPPRAAMNTEIRPKKETYEQPLKLQKVSPFQKEQEKIAFINRMNTQDEREEFLDEAELITAGYHEVPPEPVKNPVGKGKHGRL